MKCIECNIGTLEFTIIPSFARKWGNKEYIFQNVRAEVCDLCGALYFDCAEVKRMDNIIKDINLQNNNGATCYFIASEKE